MSIKRRLIILIISTVVLASFFAALHGYRNSLEQLDDVFDEELITVSAFLSGFVNQSNGLPEKVDSEITYQIFVNNQLISSSMASPNAKMTLVNQGFDEVSFHGKRWRTYSSTSVNEGSNVTIMVAHPIQKRIDAAESILFATITPIVISIPLIAFLIIYIINRSLSTLITLSNEIKDKNTDDLTEIVIHQPPEELAPVIRRMNNLFLRLANAFDREKQLAANAAHELRTPISVLKLTAHNIQSEFAQQSLTPALISELNDNVSRMAHVIEQMISLYKYTPDQFIGKKTNENLRDIVQEVISKNYEMIAQNGQTISLEGDDAWVSGEHFALSTLFENILKNAIKYSGHSTEIKVTLAQDSLATTLTVEDSGAGIDEADYLKIFERFYRVQNAVTREKGSGLGLSIVKHICDLHSANIEASKSSLGGLKISILFHRIKEVSEGVM
ncbi:HAMP domain-containing histidine kinase [Glaciecola sp. XM2]|uniref:sensor histidine kinase n=1 Tax=Glaciecola sp. XM2 TaxID=1914931 RepID=UPI001BDE1419|nr:HAMP domain-containing histidine kinase [Glaciecola sp. XM2]